MMGIAKFGLFAAGVLFGTAGVKVLSSKDAKKVYAHTTAAAIRAKDSVMTTVTGVKESAGDVLAEAKEINAKRAKAEAEKVIEDTAEAEPESGGNGRNGENEARKLTEKCRSFSGAALFGGNRSYEM